MRGHFLPRGQYTPGCRKGLGQEVSSADEIRIALVIAGDTGKHLRLAVAPTFHKPDMFGRWPADRRQLAGHGS